MKDRIIALIDCDSFFVSCEQADDKGYKGTPTCVISGKNGCVVSRSKEAKQLGVKMGMPIFMAKREYPEANYIVANHDKYRAYSKRVMECLKEFSPDIEVVSVDEAYIDLTGTQKLFKRNYVEIIKLIRKKILETTDIPVSIGISHSKILAKLASDKAKTQGGIYIIGNRKIMRELTQTKIDEICGIGRANSLTLRRYGILMGNELVAKSDEWIKSKLGVNGVELKHELLGECVSRVVNKYEPPKSIQSTSTIGDGEFSSNLNVIKMEISAHLHTACAKLRRHNLKCSSIGVMLRTKEFATLYDKKMLIKPTDFELTLQKTVNEILPKLYNSNIIYRSTGVVLENLSSKNGEQLSLFDTGNEKEEKLSQCIDNIEKRFGKNSIRTGF
jgi:DNA polymerase-4/DNA polymerase V